MGASYGARFDEAGFCVDWMAENFDPAVVDAYLDDVCKKNRLPAMAVVVVSPDKTLYSYTGGVSSHARSGSVTCDTPFILGSLSKSMVSVCVMKLLEEGRIELDAPVSLYGDFSAYFKDKRTDGDAAHVTIRSLLNHSSGIDTYQRIGSLYPTDHAGSYTYANANYALLSYLIESVTGMPYPVYLRKNLFEPLGMSKSALSREESETNGLVEGYRNFFGIPVKSRTRYPSDDRHGIWLDYPAGYVSATANDVGKYLQFYLNNGNDLVSSGAIELMLNSTVDMGGDNGDFYGFGIRKSVKEFGKTVYFHTGSVENFNSRMFIIPDEEIGICILVNMNDYFVFTKLFTDISKPLLGVQRNLDPDLYMKRHLFIDLICMFMLFVIIIDFIISIKCRYLKRFSGPFIVFDFILSGIFALIPVIIGVPYFVTLNYVTDLQIFVILCSALLFLCGIIKFVQRLVCPDVCLE